MASNCEQLTKKVGIKLNICPMNITYSYVRALSWCLTLFVHWNEFETILFKTDTNGLDNLFQHNLIMSRLNNQGQ